MRIEKTLRSLQIASLLLALWSMVATATVILLAYFVLQFGEIANSALESVVDLKHEVDDLKLRR